MVWCVVGCSGSAACDPYATPALPFLGVGVSAFLLCIFILYSPQVIEQVPEQVRAAQLMTKAVSTCSTSATMHSRLKVAVLVRPYLETISSFD